MDEAFVFLKTYSMEPLVAWCPPVVVWESWGPGVTRGGQGFTRTSTWTHSLYLLIHSRSGHAWIVVIGCCMVWAQMTKYGHVRAGDMGWGEEDKDWLVPLPEHMSLWRIMDHGHGVRRGGQGFTRTSTWAHGPDVGGRVNMVWAHGRITLSQYYGALWNMQGCKRVLIMHTYE